MRGNIAFGPKGCPDRLQAPSFSVLLFPCGDADGGESEEQGQAYAGDDIDDVMPSKKHGGDDDVGGEKRSGYPGVFIRAEFAMSESEKKTGERPGGMQGGEDIFLRPRAVDGIEHVLIPEAQGEGILEFRGKELEGAVAGHDHV